MLAYIKGKILGIYDQYAIIEVESNNTSIGYEVALKTTDLLSCKNGEYIGIYVKEIIKEDDDALYGFTSFEDRCWFEEFIKLSGLGPKIALTILSTYSINSIEEAINSNDCGFFQSVSGIGAKLANRIPTEMVKILPKINQRVLLFNGNSNLTSEFKSKSVKKSKTLINLEDDEDEQTSGGSGSSNNTSSGTKKDEEKNIKFGKNQKKVENNNQAKINADIIKDSINALDALGFSKQNIYNDVYSITKKSKNLSVEGIVKKFLEGIDKK